MEEEFLHFHSFSDAALADEFVRILGSAGIKFELEKEAVMLDKQSWFGASSDPEIIIKIRSSEFEAAHVCLQSYFDSHFNEIDKDYYLFSASNDELLEIIQKPDEWGDLNYRLAQKILTDRGEDPGTSRIQQLKQMRIEELAKPEKTDWGVVGMGYLFVAAGLVFLLPIIEAGYTFSPYGFVVCLFLGRHLAYNKKILPDGSKVFAYNAYSRKHGRIIIIAAIIVFCISVAAWLISDNMNE